MKRKLIPLLLVFGMLLLIGVPAADAGVVRVVDVDYVRILDAYYANLDDDGVEDDIKLLVEFAFPAVESIRVDLNIWIELPSGLTYYFRVSVWRAPADSILNIDCIDMATESGWYTVYLLTEVKSSGGSKYYIVDELVFDPPTSTGPGLPGVVAYF